MEKNYGVLNFDEKQIDVFNAYVGYQMQEERRKAKLSQAQMAQKCGVSPNTISNLERGVTKPAAHMIYSYAKILDVDVNVFLDFDLSEIFRKQDTVFPKDKMSAIQTLDRILPHLKEDEIQILIATAKKFRTRRQL